MFKYLAIFSLCAASLFSAQITEHQKVESQKRWSFYASPQVYAGYMLDNSFVVYGIGLNAQYRKHHHGFKFGIYSLKKIKSHRDFAVPTFTYTYHPKRNGFYYGVQVSILPHLTLGYDKEINGIRYFFETNTGTLFFASGFGLSAGIGF